MVGKYQAYDLVIIGGGIAGSTLGRAMALSGAEVLIVEKEVQYRDRIRGEVLLPWGSVEAKNLGIYDILLQSCARESPHEMFFLAGEPTPPRHFPSSTPRKTCVLSFFHPDMQETLARAAAEAGVDVWRGAALKAINGDQRRALEIVVDGTVRAVEARLIVGADGRESNVAMRLGLKRERSAQELFSVGFQLSGDLPLEPALYFFLHGESGRGTILIETRPRNYRAYLFHHKDALERRLSGERDYQTAMQHFREIGVPTAWLDAATPHGILASFDGAFRWIDHPAINNCALVGDAASTTDPVWGNGLSRTLRDVRLLRDRLLNDNDWVAAANAYAQDHDDYYQRLRFAEQLKNAIFFTMGAAAEARRQRVFALMENDPTVSLDLTGRGPEFGYSDELAARLLAL
jgi:2-polyprenyl-6-methoxyphenol hydroxylase-like FAD-dependent oxidoreductase